MRKIKNTLRIYYPNGNHEVIHDVEIDAWGEDGLVFTNIEPPSKIGEPQRIFSNITTLPFWFREERKEE